MMNIRIAPAIVVRHRARVLAGFLYVTFLSRLCVRRRASFILYVHFLYKLNYLILYNNNSKLFPSYFFNFKLEYQWKVYQRRYFFKITGVLDASDLSSLSATSTRLYWCAYTFSL